MDVDDAIKGAWSGRIAGCLLGKPVEGFYREKLRALLKKTGNFPMSDYIRREAIPEAAFDELSINKDACWMEDALEACPVDDDTNYTAFALKLVETYGRDFRPQDVLEGWMSWIPFLSLCTAERVAYRNGAMGMAPPDTAGYKNPYREWIGAQIRGDLFGYINPGNPELAADMAWRDASISHIKNGIYGEMFIAACIAAAPACGSISDVVAEGLAQIPYSSRLAEQINKMLELYNGEASQEEALNYIYAQFDEKSPHDWCHTVSNALIVVWALLYGRGDFAPSICSAVSAGFDTDCNGATVGSILGMYGGMQIIPPLWYEAYHSALRTTVADYELITIDELARRTSALSSQRYDGAV
jgi:ADP-ribosylglycohydrolase